MFCGQILGNVETDRRLFASATGKRDDVIVHWWELDRRAWKKTTVGGRPIRILLPRGQGLKHGDVLAADESALIVVCVLPTEVLSVKPTSGRESALVCLELGNLHAPTEVDGDAIYVVPDGPVEAVLGELGVRFELTLRRFNPRMCAGMPALSISSDLRVTASRRE